MSYVVQKSPLQYYLYLTMHSEHYLLPHVSVYSLSCLSEILKLNSKMSESDNQIPHNRTVALD